MRPNVLLCLFLGWTLAAAACAGAPVETSKRLDASAVRAPSAPPAAVAVADAAARAPIHARLLAFNDFHGTLKPPTGRVPNVAGEVGGAAYLAAHLRRLGAGQPDVLVVAAGDLIGASPLTSSLFHHEPTVDVMNTLGLSVTSLGNHELDQGMAELLRIKNGGCHPKDGCRFKSTFAGARYDILGANVTETKTRSSPLPPWVAREVSGIPIAFVGLTLQDTPRSVVPEGVAGLSFADEVTTANALVPEIRARGIEAMVLLVHEGGEVRSPALDACDDLRGPIVRIAEGLDRAFDVVVSGHTHALYNCTVAGRSVTSALSFGRVVTSVDLTIDPKTRDIVRSEAHQYAVTHDVSPDPAVQAIVDRASAEAGAIESRPIGRIAETLTGHGHDGRESALGAVIADAQLEATRKHGAEVALMNAGGVRSDLLYPKTGEEKEDGVVTYGEAFAAQPFGNQLVTLTITARQLVSVLERELGDGSGLLVSEGLEVRYSSSSGKRRVVEVKLRGARLDPTRPVRVTTNSFLAARNPVLAEGTHRVTGPLDIEALEAYFASHARVVAPKGRRVLRE